jgi:hypothetical protein
MCAGLMTATAAPALAAAPLDLREPGAVFEPGEPVEWQLWVGFVGGLAPFVIALYEFTKRIVIQRQCAVCAGSGLVQKGRFKRKCPACGTATAHRSQCARAPFGVPRQPTMKSCGDDRAEGSTGLRRKALKGLGVAIFSAVIGPESRADCSRNQRRRLTLHRGRRRFELADCTHSLLGRRRRCVCAGGFLPWESWGQFFSSGAGNGSVVRVPKGQTSVIYDVAAARAASETMRDELMAADAREVEAEAEAEAAGSVSKSESRH